MTFQTPLIRDAAGPGLTLRDYQREAHDAVIAYLRENPQGRPAIQVPTGGGKTVIFASVAKTIGYPVLVLAHRDELLDQAADKFRMVDPGVSVGKVKAETNQPWAEVVVASVQTLARPQRLAAMPKHYRLIIVDEAHHVTAPSYRQILGHFHGTPVLGVSATLERGDGSGLEGVLDELVYQRDMLQMIGEGYLCDIRPYQIQLADFNFARIKMGVGRRDFADGALGSALHDAGAAGYAVKAYQKHAADRRAIAFTPTIELAHEFADTFNEAGIAAAAVSGDTPKHERHDVYRKLRSGEIRVVANAMVLCLDSDTEILTDQGWARPDTMTPQHKVANWEDGWIEFHEPLDIVRRPRGPHERMISLHGATRDLRVTETHRMLYRLRHQAKWTKVSARELVGRGGIVLPASGVAEPFDVKPEQPHRLIDAERTRRISAAAYNLRRGGAGWDESFAEATCRHDQRQALRYKNPDELTADECRLIGFWLGDGSRARLQKGGVEYTLSQSKAYPNIIAWVDELLARLDLDVARREPDYGTVAHVRWALARGTGFGSQKRRGVFALEPYLDKSGSRLLWGLNEEQFAAFLEGWWYADGQHGAADSAPRATIRIYNADRDLLSLVQAVAVCRGYSASVLEGSRPKKDAHRQLHVLVLRKGAEHHISATHALRVEETWVDEDVWCVKTQTKNIVTRRRGRVTVMGNTEGFDEPTVDCIIVSRPTLSRSLFIQMVGRGLRTHPGKDDCVVLDMVGNTDRVRLVTIPNLFGLSSAAMRDQQTVTQAIAVQQQQAQQQKKPELRDIESLAVDLFTQRKFAWRTVRRHDREFFILTAGDDGFVTLAPVPDSDELYNVIHEKRRDGIEIVAGGLSLEYAQGAAEDYVRRLGAAILNRKEASWRRKPVSEKQRAALRNWKVDEETIAALETAGEASDLLTETIATKRRRAA